MLNEKQLELLRMAQREGELLARLILSLADQERMNCMQLT